MNPRRILVATLRYPPYVAGGYEILTRDAVEGLRARGHQVSVLCGKGAGFGGEPGILPWLDPPLPEEGEDENLFRLSHEGTNLERFRLHFLRRSNQRATERALDESRAELLFFFNLGLASLAPIVAARQRRLPTLGFVTDPWPLNHWVRDWSEHSQSVRKGLRLGLLRWLWRRFRSGVDLGPLLVSSDYLRESFVEDGIDLGSMELLHLPAPPELMPEVPPEAPTARPAGEPLRVLCLSMHWEGKGIHVLLDAVARAVRGGTNLELHLGGIGNEAYVDRLRRKAAAPELEGRVHWHGLLPRPEVSRRIGQAHVLALPSLWGEPFPLSTLEAMAHGVALVASDAGGTPEQFSDGVEGLQVPAGDAEAMASALERFAADEEFRLSCGRQGLARVAREYTMVRFLDGVETAITRILDP